MRITLLLLLMEDDMKPAVLSLTLSPLICQFHYQDETIDEYIINTDIKNEFILFDKKTNSK